LNRKQRAMEERYKADSGKPGKFYGQRKEPIKYYPPAKPCVRSRKHNKLKELLLQTGVYTDPKHAKANAERLLRRAERFKTIDEWALWDTSVGFWSFMNGTTQKAEPPKEMILAWDVHTGKALTKLYNALT
jgi:hypothetical protein